MRPALDQGERAPGPVRISRARNFRHRRRVTRAAPTAARSRRHLGENELDLELVKRVQRGDKTAFDLLVLKYQHRIGAVIGRFVPDHAEAQDIAQESFIRAYRALGNFRGDSQFYTWLYRIAVNTAK